MDWTTEQEGQRREWGLDDLESDPANMKTVDPMDEFLRRKREAQEEPDVRLS